MKPIQLHLNSYQCFFDDKPVFHKHAVTWQEALSRAKLWCHYFKAVNRPYKTIEILNLFTGEKLPLDECIRRAELFIQYHKS